MIAAGGTGGHVYPAVAVARELAALAPGRPLTFLGGAAGLEARVVPREGFRFLAVPSGPWRRSRPWTAVRGAALALQGAVRARAVLRAERASAVFSTGGFAAAPTLIAAAATGIPIVLHEPNEVPGLVTRLFARVAARVTTGSAGAAARIGGARVLVTGVPVRASLLAGDREADRRALGVPPEAFVVLVLGGSQGASAINDAVAAALPLLADAPAPIVLVWACGRGGEAAATAAADRFAGRARGPADHDANGGPVRSADAAVARAGASTVAELMAGGVPAILVPYPHAAANHQWHNASALAREGAALLLEEPRLDGRRLAELLHALAADRGRREAMAERARASGRPGAARAVAEAVLEAVAC